MKIPALQLEVDGELVAIAGANGLSFLTGTIGLGSGQGKTIDASQIIFGVIGVDVHSPQPQQLTWGSGVTLKLGDRVTFQVVEVEQPFPPDKVMASPSSAQLSVVASRRSRTGRT
jgi:hypothetical protein